MERTILMDAKTEALGRVDACAKEYTLLMRDLLTRHNCGIVYRGQLRSSLWIPKTDLGIVRGLIDFVPLVETTQEVPIYYTTLQVLFSLVSMSKCICHGQVYNRDIHSSRTLNPLMICRYTLHRICSSCRGVFLNPTTSTKAVIASYLVEPFCGNSQSLPARQVGHSARRPHIHS